MTWAAAGQIRPLVSRSYALDKFADAMRAKWHGETVGGIPRAPYRSQPSRAAWAGQL